MKLKLALGGTLADARRRTYTGDTQRIRRRNLDKHTVDPRSRKVEA